MPLPKPARRAPAPEPEPEPEPGGTAQAGFAAARAEATGTMPLSIARRLLSSPATAATTRLYSASGVSSQYWLNPQSKYRLVDILGTELAERLRALELAALDTMKRRLDTDAAAAQEEAEQEKMAEQMAADAAEAERAEVRAAFESIDLDGNGTLERDELEQAAERLGQHMSPDELDAAMAEMDADGSGEVDFEEFMAWWERHRDDPGGGLFGGLFDNPLEMSDAYLSSQIAVAKRAEEAAAASAEAHEAAQQLEAVSLEVGLRLRAFAEFERQNMLLEEQGGKKAQPHHAQLRLGSAEPRRRIGEARRKLMLGPPRGARRPPPPNTSALPPPLAPRIAAQPHTIARGSDRRRSAARATAARDGGRKRAGRRPRTADSLPSSCAPLHRGYQAAAAPRLSRLPQDHSPVLRDVKQ